MAKRFTDSYKWRDKWFRALRPEFKLAWLYILDNCDHAGIIEIDEELANFQMGTALDWESFVSHCGDRLERVAKGKIWIVGFVGFQYGALSGDCRAHNPAVQSLSKYGLLERVSKGYSKVLDTDKDKDKDKDKNKDIVLEEWIVPENLDSPQVRKLLADFAKMRSRIKKPIRDFASTSLTLKRFDDQDHLCFALETCIANDYQGLKPDYRPDRKSVKHVSAGVNFDPNAKSKNPMHGVM